MTMTNGDGGIPPTTPLTATLEAQQWNVVLMALGKLPYETSALLIQAIVGQLQKEAAATLPRGVATNGSALQPDN
jgi:hypothetical protein